MQHDLVMKKLNFDHLTRSQGKGGGGGSADIIFATYSCICDSLKFDVQHDHVLKKLKAYLHMCPRMNFL